jgi:hypothetical protein
MTMNPGFRNSLYLLLLSITGCGGGGSSDGGSSTPGAGTAYAFITPVLNSTLSYGVTIIDNSNNTIDMGTTSTVTSVDSDGTYVIQTQPTNPTAIVNGTNYAGPPMTLTYNASGQELTNVYTSGTVFTCTFDPHGFGPDFPVQVGQTWTLDYTYGCNSNAPIAYSQTGSVVDVESVTVPAGTFSAIKLQSTITWTDTLGTTRTQTVTNWRDVATSISVKEEISYSYSGTLPTNGYPTSRVDVLLSTS